MGDAASQCADAFHPLRPHELGFDLLFIRDVGIDSQHRFGLPFIVADERPASLNSNLASVFGKVLEVSVPFALADRESVDFFKFMGIGVKKSADIATNNFLGSPPVHPLGPLVPKQNLSFE